MIQDWVIYDRRWKDYADGQVYHYVGQSCNFEGRKRGYLNQFGFTCRVIVLERFRGSQARADQRERHWVATFRVRFGDRLENLTNGGQHWPPDFKGLHRTEEQRRRYKEVHCNPEVRKHHSEAARRRWARLEERQRLSKSMRRAHARPDAQRKWNESLRRSWANPDDRKRRIEILHRTMARPEVNQKRIEGLRRSKAMA